MASTAGTRRCPGDRTRTVQDAFGEEQSSLISLPEDAYPCDERVEVHVGKTPYVRFDLNDYSVPADFARRTVVAVASLDTVRLLDGPNVVATHRRSWSRGEQIEDERHVAELVERKRAAREHRAMDRLAKATPSSQAFLKAMAERGGNIGNAVARLTKLLDAAGAEALEAAIVGALEHERVHVGAVHQLVDEYRSRLGKLPAVSNHVAPAHRGRVVRSHPLSGYDSLTKEHNDERS